MALAALVALAALLSTFTIFGTRGVAHLLNLHAQRRALGEHAFALLQGNRILRDRIGRLRGDERYLEALARANLGLVREGEIVYRFTGAAPPAGPP
jgi:cell division protein FtsB